MERPWESDYRVPMAPPEPGVVSRTPQPVPVAQPRWGWRALVAFLAGGLLTGIGVAAGYVSRESASPEVATVTTAPLVVADVGAEPAAAVADLLGPSVVQVETDIGLGSGIVIGPQSVVSNHHVIAGADQIRIRLSDGRTYEVSLVGSDSRTDVALLDVNEDVELPVAPLAVDDPPVVGELAVAIGSPFQLQKTVTMGIVSAVNRPIFNGTGWNAMVQTDAAINPGNSGGALADRSGAVIGINTAIQTDGNSMSSAGVGFAMPISTVMDVVDRLRTGGSLEPAFLGIRGQAPANHAVGVELVSVDPGSAAEEAGLAVGDIVTSIDGAPVTEFRELAGLIQTGFPGDEVELEVNSGGDVRTVTVVLGES